MVIDAV